MKVIKDNVLHRLKAYNLSQLVDFMVTRFEDYYIRRLTDFASNRVVRRQPRPSTSDVDCQRITRKNTLEMEFLLGLLRPSQVRSGGEPPSHQDEASDATYEATSSSVAGTSTSDTEDLKRQLDDFVGDLKRKLEEDESYSAPVKAFLSTFSKLHTDSAIQSALFSIGKAPQAQPMGRKRPRGFLQTTTTIGVQPTAVRRRKTPLGGRRSLGAGRPPKSSKKEHGYHKKGRAKPAPHNLSFCVQENSALGKTH
ncbi:uncharacterized protein LOC130125479 [Lampris incognitus]|uniref:uncharacterized protein LOC130125479 n=1 Tax=Lampris incognitus TaxID=2546036 RepID=UPI0024B62AFE|nr:uncharacterized protein LOC130125479 [Lampris incognitus]